MVINTRNRDKAESTTGYGHWYGRERQGWSAAFAKSNPALEAYSEINLALEAYSEINLALEAYSEINLAREAYSEINLALAGEDCALPLHPLPLSTISA